ncbi:hypothetical protein R8Z50_24170 [Longispora sp. K20-0274]|uniref:hypothetical protein n=1 Tax=Longispora sp. K20-0274 TaxID=3088255 RepID=UPI00399BB27F
MFTSTHRFAFFDYFRVPYQVIGGPDPDLGTVRGPAGRLRWPLTGGVAGRYDLDGTPLFGRVLPDRSARRLLGPGDWRVDAPIRDARGRHVASVWRSGAGDVFLPFDPGEAMHQFWSEGYRATGRLRPLLVKTYYLVRPALPRRAQLAARRLFARLHHAPEFPAWPVETALHDLQDRLFALLVDVAGEPVPWLDLWPAGHTWAVVLTHDVETAAGCRDLHLLRDIEREHGHTSEWNFVPLRYRVGDDVLAGLRAEGCEIGVHGVRHDGRDLGSRRLLRRRLPVMREYAARWGAVGFRSPATQRTWDWMPLLGFDYDMSYHDTAPYEPTPGGGCSWLPYPNGDLLELPITLPQDHTLFTILGHPDAAVWLSKAAAIRARGGMMLVLTHPDYAGDPRAADGYRRLLEEVRHDASAWWANPGEVSAWWRRRAASGVERVDGDWAVTGPAADTGRVVYALAGVAALAGRSSILPNQFISVQDIQHLPDDSRSRAGHP